VTRASFTILLYGIIDCVLLIVSLSHIPSLQSRAAFPFTAEEQNGTIIVSRIESSGSAGGLSAGDTLLSVNDASVTMIEQLEFVADLCDIGKACPATVSRNGTPVRLSVTTVPYYPTLLYIVITYFVGISFLIVGCFVLWTRPRELIAHLFHWMMVLVGTVIMITWGRIEPGTMLTLIVRPLFFAAYMFGIASFYFFTTLYCTKTPTNVGLYIGLAYSLAAVICAIMIYHHMTAIAERSLSAYAEFQRYFDLFHSAIIVVFIAGTVNIVRAYRGTVSADERSRLEWIMWGFFISSTPFLLLYIIPQLLLNRYLIPEEYTTIFFIALPFSFGVSFIKHHLFDIRLLIKRTIVAALFSTIIAVTYFIIVLLAAAVVSDSVLTSEQFVVVAVTLVIAMVLNPVRSGLQRYIDRILFKAHSEYGRILSDFSKQMLLAVDELQVHSIVLSAIRASLPVEHCYWYRRSDQTLKPVSNGETADGPDDIPIDAIQHLLDHQCSAVASIIRTPVPETVTIENSLIALTGVELFVPIRSSRGPVIAAAGIRRSETKERYDADELSLLAALCRIAGEQLGRLEMMESIFREKEERKRAEELNRQKSDFVSYVSHELQTPLTSIRMFSELLQKQVRGTTAREQLQIVTGESERLSRMVNNLLDVSRIESGLKEYRLEPCELNSIIRSVVTKMAYMIEKHGFSLRTSIPRRKIHILADADAIEQAMVNLLSNAIKYSRKNKRIRITATTANNKAVLTVEDRGDGIPPEQLPFLFKKFYRSPQHHHTVKGVGLGLSLVHHIVDAHHGTIGVRSAVGAGTTFTITLPLYTSTEPT
jgi:signal transduction histidine kinase